MQGITGSPSRTIPSAALAVALLAAPWSAVLGAGPATVCDLEADGSDVVLRIANPVPYPVVVTVTVEARLANGDTRVFTEDLPLAPGAVTETAVPLDDDVVRDVVVVGIVLDDGVPF